MLGSRRSRRSRKGPSRTERKSKVVFVAHPVQQKKRPQRKSAKQPRVSAAPIAISRGTSVVLNNNKTMTYRRREFVTSLRTPDGGDSDATLLTLELNPGLGKTFPWLHSVSAFEQYKFKNISFTFNSSTSTSERGQIIMVTNVDAKDAVMTQISELMSYSGACIGRVWDSHVHKVPSQAVTKKNYVRNSAPPANADLSLYDAGLFYFAVTGVQPGIPIGTLWVEYDVEFFTPKYIPSSQVLNIVGKSGFGYSFPLGSIDTWQVDPNSTISYTASTDDLSFTSLVIDPNGMDTFQFDLIAYAAQAGGTSDLLGPLGGSNFDVINQAISEVKGISDGKNTTFNLLTTFAKIIDKTKPLVLHFSYITEMSGLIGEASPQLSLSLFRTAPGFV